MNNPETCWREVTVNIPSAFITFRMSVLFNSNAELTLKVHFNEKMPLALTIIKGDMFNMTNYIT